MMRSDLTTPLERRGVREREPSAALVPVRPRRRPWLIASGILLASIGALSVVWLVGAAGQRQEVLAVRQDVSYGQVLTEADLTVARVSVDPGVAVVPSDATGQVVGQVAVTRLVPGMLLAPGMVEPVGEPGPGRVLVPVALPAERMPAGGARPGDRILAVRAASGTSELAGGASGSPGGGAGRGVDATVVRVGAADVNGVTVMDVTVAQADGPDLAVAAANGEVALVVRPSGS